MNNLKAHILQLLSFSEPEWQEIAECCTARELQKGEVFIDKGAKCNHEVYISAGVVRAFLIDEDGNEKTTAFFKANEFLSTSAHRTNRSGCSLYTYQAVSNAQLVFLNSEMFSKLYLKHDKLKKLVADVKEREVLRINNRDEILLQVRAEEKYKKFREYMPNLEFEIAHHYIASFMGITPVSLSRIRKKMGIATER